MKEEPSSILIVLLGAIGDVTRALALAERIKTHWPSVVLTWAVEPKSRVLVENHPTIDRVVLFDRPKGFFAYLRFIQELRSTKYDIVLDLQRHFKSGATSFFSGGRQRIGFHRRNAKEFNWLFNNDYIEPVDNFSPKIMHYQRFGDALGLPSMKKLCFGLEPSAQEVKRVEEIITAASHTLREPLPGPEKRAALILGSTWPSRLWRVSYYREVVKALFENWGMVSILVGAASEESYAKQLIDGDEALPLVNLVNQTSLQELAALFSLVRLAIGSDSGPMHIAAACGIPVISLWGSTSPLRSAPCGSESLVLQSPIACSPCYRRKCPGLDTLCMADIPAEAVIARVESIIQ